MYCFSGVTFTFIPFLSKSIVSRTFLNFEAPSKYPEDSRSVFFSPATTRSSLAKSSILMASYNSSERTSSLLKIASNSFSVAFGLAANNLAVSSS